MKHKSLIKPLIIKHEDFFVLRDDLLPGGTKRRVLMEILSEIKQQEIVYPSHAYGYGGLALGLAGIDTGKKIHLFFDRTKTDTDIFLQTIKLPNVKFTILEDAKKQLDLTPFAKKYATEHQAHFMPIGFNFPEFSEGLVKLAQSLQILPKEVWVLGGSGTLSRSLQKAWPLAQVNTVSLGFPQGDMGRSKVFNVLEKTEEVANLPPPYPSSLYYDAKIWSFAKKYGSKGSFIWNVA
jgi:hypothetical protein